MMSTDLQFHTPCKEPPPGSTYSPCNSYSQLESTSSFDSTTLQQTDMQQSTADESATDDPAAEILYQPVSYFDQQCRRREFKRLNSKSPFLKLSSPTTSPTKDDTDYPFNNDNCSWMDIMTTSKSENDKLNRSWSDPPTDVCPSKSRTKTFSARAKSAMMSPRKFSLWTLRRNEKHTRDATLDPVKEECSTLPHTSSSHQPLRQRCSSEPLEVLDTVGESSSSRNGALPTSCSCATFGASFNSTTSDSVFAQELMTSCSCQNSGYRHSAALLRDFGAMRLLSDDSGYCHSTESEDNPLTRQCSMSSLPGIKTPDSGVGFRTPSDTIMSDMHTMAGAFDCTDGLVRRFQSAASSCDTLDSGISCGGTIDSLASSCGGGSGCGGGDSKSQNGWFSDQQNNNKSPLRSSLQRRGVHNRRTGTTQRCEVDEGYNSSRTPSRSSSESIQVVISDEHAVNQPTNTFQHQNRSDNHRHGSSVRAHRSNTCPESFLKAKARKMQQKLMRNHTLNSSEKAVQKQLTENNNVNNTNTNNVNINVNTITEQCRGNSKISKQTSKVGSASLPDRFSTLPLDDNSKSMHNKFSTLPCKNNNPDTRSGKKSITDVCFDPPAPIRRRIIRIESFV